MSQMPFEQAGGLRIGTVEYVSPDRIEVVLDIEAPESVALNAGLPRPFPRVNGYLLIAVEEGFLAGQIEWITVERSAFPKRRGMRDFGLVDLPYHLESCASTRSVCSKSWYTATLFLAEAQIRCRQLARLC